MDNNDFERWYRANLKMMTDAGIMHPSSEAGRWVKVALTAAQAHYEHRIQGLEQRLKELENQTFGEKPVQKSTPKVQTTVTPLPPVETLEPKAKSKPTTKKAVAKPKAKAIKPRAKKPPTNTSGWSI